MGQLIDTTSAVWTPERVAFRYRLAGPSQRAVAWLLDAILRFVFFAMLTALLIAVSVVPGLDGVGTGLWLLALFLLDWFYGVLFEGLMSGRTPGKLVVELRVVRDDGAPVGWADVVLRNLLRAVDFLPFGFGLGAAIMALDPKSRRLGDLVAGTVVVSEGRAKMLGAVVIDPPVSDEERQQLPGRVDLSPDELVVIENFLRRKSKMAPERAEELAELFAPQLSARTGVEAPTHERVLTLAYARATGKDGEGA